MAQTPGPWHHDGRRWIRNADGHGVLRVQLGANPDDVRLAAAAPVMLATLHSAQKLLDWVTRNISRADYEHGELGQPLHETPAWATLENAVGDGTLAAFRLEFKQAIAAAEPTEPPA